MLPVSWGTIRLTLHVLAATIWVGGQLTLAALVPALDASGPRRVVPAGAGRLLLAARCGGVRRS